MCNEQFVSSRNSRIISNLFSDCVLSMALTFLAGASTAMIDGILTSRFLGSQAMAAYGIASAYYSVTSFVRNLLMIGCVSVCTRIIGKHDSEKLSSVFSITVMLAIIISFAWLSFGILFTDNLSVIFGAREHQITITSAYLKGVFLGSPAFMCYVILVPLMYLDGNKSRVKTSNIVLAVVDVIGDLLVVFLFQNNFISLNTAVFGMGFASSASHIAALVVVVPYFFREDCIFKIGRMKIADLSEIFSDGSTKALSQSGRIIEPMVVYPLVFSVGGTIALTGFAILHNVAFIAIALSAGISSALLTMAGISYGEQDIDGIQSVMAAMFKNIFLRVCPLSIVIILIAPYIVNFYIPAGDRDALFVSCMALRCYAVSLPFLTFNESLANYFLILKRRFYSYLTSFFSELIMPVSIAFILSKFFGINGIFIALAVGQIVLTVIIISAAIFFRDTSRKGFRQFLMLPSDFGVSASDVLAANVKTLDDAINLSESAKEFCMRHDVDRKRSLHISLCIEELCINVIQHGFKGGKQYNLDARLVADDGKLILRLRDDCMPFDMKKMAAEWKFDPENPVHHIGTRLVMKYAEDIRYVNMMNTNNLMVIL